MDDQFFLGEDLLLAPVSGENVTERDLFLPPGQWIDAWSGTSYPSGLIKNFPAPCPGIPVFVRGTERALAALIMRHLKAIPRGTIRSGQTSAIYRAGLDRDLSVTG